MKIPFLNIIRNGEDLPWRRRVLTAILCYHLIDFCFHMLEKECFNREVRLVSQFAQSNPFASESGEEAYF